MNGPQAANSQRTEKLSKTSTVTEYAAQYQQAYPRLAAVAAGVLGRREGAEDIVQEAAGLAVEKQNEFAGPAEFVAWMFGVVRRMSLNERRKTQRRQTYATDPSDIATLKDQPTTEQPPVDPATGQLTAQQVSFEDHLLAALQELSEDARCCLLLRTVHDLSYAEIEQLLGIPRGTAMSHVHRSRQLLRTRLQSPDTARDLPSTSN